MCAFPVCFVRCYVLARNSVWIFVTATDALSYAAAFFIDPLMMFVLFRVCGGEGDRKQDE